MNNLEKELIEKVGVYDWVNEMNQRYFFSPAERLVNANQSIVKDTVRKVGYHVGYFRSSKTYNVPTKLASTIFYGNFHVAYGYVVFDLFARKNDLKIGAQLDIWCKQYEGAIGVEREKYIFPPCIRNYEELRDILREYFVLYEKFKVAVHESGYLQNP